jgi:hypothetical protein
MARGCLVRARLFGNTDVMPIDQFPAFPAVEEQQQYGCKRYPKTSWKNSRGRLGAVSQIPIDRCEDHRNQVTGHMEPSIVQVANCSLPRKSVKPNTAATSAIITPAPNNHIAALAQTPAPVIQNAMSVAKAVTRKNRKRN